MICISVDNVEMARITKYIEPTQLERMDLSSILAWVKRSVAVVERKGTSEGHDGNFLNFSVSTRAQKG